MPPSLLRVLAAADLHRKERFHLFDRSTASKRLRNRLYYSKNKARIKAHRRLYRLRHRYHDKVDTHLKITRPTWSVGQETRNNPSVSAGHHVGKRHTLNPSAPKMFRAGLPRRRAP